MKHYSPSTPVNPAAPTNTIGPTTARTHEDNNYVTTVPPPYASNLILPLIIPPKHSFLALITAVENLLTLKHGVGIKEYLSLGGGRAK
jgi:hypothetical protein